MDGSSFVFPNDSHVAWSIMIVLYPYITGLVAGAFFVSALYHVFHQEVLRPVARLARQSVCLCGRHFGRHCGRHFVPRGKRPIR